MCRVVCPKRVLVSDRDGSNWVEIVSPADLPSHCTLRTVGIIRSNNGLSLVLWSLCVSCFWVVCFQLGVSRDTTVIDPPGDSGRGVRESLSQETKLRRRVGTSKSVGKITRDISDKVGQESVLKVLHPFYFNNEQFTSSGGCESFPHSTFGREGTSWVVPRTSPLYRVGRRR